MLSAIAGRFPLLHTARIVLRNAKLMTSLRRNGRSVCNFIFARGVPRDAPARVCGPCPRPDFPLFGPCGPLFCKIPPLVGNFF